ncbi:MAG: nucleotide exchange factor GrpE [Hyphomonas sp.]|nr:nucleotide exchange factor GrpE [Hyphomonas sp.]
MSHKSATETATPADEADNAALDPLATLEAEKAELKDKLLRTLADMENLRRRTEREVGDAKAYAVTGFARDLLGVADNLRRALESLGPDAQAALDPAMKAMVEGIELTERELIKTLEKHNVKKLDPLGQKFDPNLHQAMFEAPDPTHAKGHVVAVVQSGYAISGRVLRPALVGVSSGAPKTEPAPDSAIGSGSPPESQSGD